MQNTQNTNKHVESQTLLGFKMQQNKTNIVGIVKEKWMLTGPCDHYLFLKTEFASDRKWPHKRSWSFLVLFHEGFVKHDFRKQEKDNLTKITAILNTSHMYLRRGHGEWRENREGKQQSFNLKKIRGKDQKL